MIFFKMMPTRSFRSSARLLAGRTPEAAREEAHAKVRELREAARSWFQSEGHWSEPSEIVREMVEAGYSGISSFEFLPSQSFQIFEQGEAHAGVEN